MNQTEADLIAWARGRIESVASTLRQLEAGVTCASMPDPKPVRRPIAAHTPPRPRVSPAKPLHLDLAATPVPDCDLIHADTLGHGSHHHLAVTLARSAYAAERLAPTWVDLGGEG